MYDYYSYYTWSVTACLERYSFSVRGTAAASLFTSKLRLVVRFDNNFWVFFFYRCLPRTGFPPVDNIQSLSSLTMVPCLSHVDKQTLSQ